MQNSTIMIEHLTKKYNEKEVLHDITVSFSKGKLYGLIGRNGSGKTMLLKSICGFIKPSSGTIRVDGKTLWKDMDIPPNMGIIIEKPGFLPDKSGYKNLQLLSIVQGSVAKEEIREVMKRVGLDPDSRKKVGKYSMGMKQKLGIAQAIMGNPEILLLDEPMNGLDEESVQLVRGILQEFKEKNALIILASHVKEDIELLCDEVYVMSAGELKRS